MPKAEIILWSKLRRKQLQDERFRRQYSIGSYVVDFYCPSLKLAIEVDGDSHTDASMYHDQERQEFIESYGIRFLRFTNDDVCENLEWVLDEIYETIEHLTKPGNKR